MADVHGSTVTASVLALPDFFTSHASTERVLTSVLEDTRGARGEEIRQGQRQGRMADNSVDMGADMGAVAPSHAWERGAPDPAPMPWERRSHPLVCIWLLVVHLHPACSRTAVRS